MITALSMFVLGAQDLSEVPRKESKFTFARIMFSSPEPPYAKFLIPRYFGVIDDNGRLMMVVDYNNDISEYWGWSNDPIMPSESSNEAYKYGVN